MSEFRTVLTLTFACVAFMSVAKAQDTACPRAAPLPGYAASTEPAAQVSGMIVAVAGTQLTVQTRTGQNVTVDAAPAMNTKQSTLLLVGRAVDILGTVGRWGVVSAEAIRHAKDNPDSWTPDCPPAS